MESFQEGTMQALICRKIGDPTGPLSESSPIFIPTDHPVPQLTSPTLVRIRVKAVSVNYNTVLQIMGKFVVPPGCDLVAAGGLPLAFGTSHVALVHRAGLRPGQVGTH
eukprot:Gb_29255 [translate_table: standard]